MSRIFERLVCPVHKTRLHSSERALSCDEGCQFPVVSGVPMLLPRNVAYTHEGMALDSFRLADKLGSGEGIFAPRDGIDSFVQRHVADTNSHLYRSIIGKLETYPIPDIPMFPKAANDLLLDIGCGWGRWTIAAAKKGFYAVGIDPSLEAVLAAKRVATQCNVPAEFLVADSRYLPFLPSTFDAAFSFSVLQHFSKQNVIESVKALSEVMRPGGVTKLHLLNRFGLRGLMVQTRRAWREARDFETRYWSRKEMLDHFTELLGPSHLEIDAFFVQGRYEDRHLFKARHRIILELSQILKKLAEGVTPLVSLADGIFVVSEVR